MVLRKKLYKDEEKFNRTRYLQRRKYYRKTQRQKRRVWEPNEEDQVLNSPLTDTQLAEKLERSVQAIQTRRWILKKREVQE